MARTKRNHNPILPASVMPEQPKQRIYRAMGYARLSVEDSGRAGADTIEVQKKLICEYITAQSDMQFCGVLADNGYTGTNFSRPAFENLMDEVRTGKVDCIVVKDLSRFGRNYLEADQYLERVFPFLDIRFVAINDNFDTLTAERNSDGYIIPLKNIIKEHSTLRKGKRCVFVCGRFAASALFFHILLFGLFNPAYRRNGNTP